MVLQVLFGTLALGMHTDPPGAMTPNLPYTTIVSTQFSAIATARQEVVRDQAQWTRTWNEIQPGGQAPPVDFEKDMVIVVAAGEGDGCAHAAVASITAANGETRVEARRIRSEANCACPSVITTPVHAVQLKRQSGITVFTKTVGILPCE